MIWLGFLALALAGLAAAPFLREAAKPTMDDTARRSAPGSFGTLSRGVTHYRWMGAARGPVAVCVHGLTTPSFVWHGVAQGLGAMGFRVLIYDLYGRGYRDPPGGPQHRAVFPTQHEDMLDDQVVDRHNTLLVYPIRAE